MLKKSLFFSFCLFVFACRTAPVSESNEIIKEGINGECNLSELGFYNTSADLRAEVSSLGKNPGALNVELLKVNEVWNLKLSQLPKTVKGKSYFLWALCNKAKQCTVSSMTEPDLLVPISSEIVGKSELRYAVCLESGACSTEQVKKLVIPQQLVDFEYYLQMDDFTLSAEIRRLMATVNFESEALLQGSCPKTAKGLMNLGPVAWSTIENAKVVKTFGAAYGGFLASDKGSEFLLASKANQEGFTDNFPSLSLADTGDKCEKLAKLKEMEKGEKPPEGWEKAWDGEHKKVVNAGALNALPEIDLARVEDVLDLDISSISAEQFLANLRFLDNADIRKIKPESIKELFSKFDFIAPLMRELSFISHALGLDSVSEVEKNALDAAKQGIAEIEKIVKKVKAGVSLVNEYYEALIRIKDMLISIDKFIADIKSSLASAKAAFRYAVKLKEKANSAVDWIKQPEHYIGIGLLAFTLWNTDHVYSGFKSIADFESDFRLQRGGDQYVSDDGPMIGYIRRDIEPIPNRWEYLKSDWGAKHYNKLKASGITLGVVAAITAASTALILQLSDGVACGASTANLSCSQSIERYQKCLREADLRLVQLKQRQAATKFLQGSP